jgi:hypothetical protein
MKGKAAVHAKYSLSGYCVGRTERTNKYLLSEAGTLFKGQILVFCTFTSATYYIVHFILLLYFVGTHQQCEAG